MKKHFFGATLFITIVGFSAFIYAYFSYDNSDCGSALTARCVSTAEPLAVNEDIVDNWPVEDVAVNLKYIEAGMRSRTVKTRVNLTWNGAGDPPRTVWLQIQFHNFDGSDAGWTSEPIRVSNPFGSREGQAIETSFDCASCLKLPRNLYASASVRTRASAGKNLVYQIGDMTPVVVQE